MTRKEGAAISNLAWVTAIALTLASALGMLLTPAMLDEPWWLALIPAHLALAVGAIALGLWRWWEQKRAEIPVSGDGPGRNTWRLAVHRWGRGGPPVVLLHGLGGSGESWRGTADALEDQFRVIAPDLLGFGRSPWPKIAYTVDDHLDALDATLASEGLAQGPIVLGGHSLGAILALAWARRHPERFAGLVLVGLPCYRSRQEARTHAAGLGPLAYATVARPWLGAAICASMCLGRPLWRLLAPRMMPELPPEVARDGLLHIWESYSRTLNRCILDLDVRMLASKVRESGESVRLLHGALDEQVPLTAVEELGRSMGWALTIMPDASHSAPIEQPGACAGAIRSQLTAA